MNIFALLATALMPADAPVDFKNCSLMDSQSMSLVSCEISNNGAAPIAAISYRATLKDAARTVPWTTSERLVTQKISGGIEPGETVEHLLLFPPLPSRATDDGLIIELLELQIHGADDKVMWPPQE